MMNRYITALLVVLAATGVEAQTYRSALKLVLGDLSAEQIIGQPEAKALEEDLLTIIKALKQADLNGPHELKHITGTAFSVPPKRLYSLRSRRPAPPRERHRY